MDLKNNRRLKEVKLAIYLNHIDKTKDKIEYKKLFTILSCLALSFGEEANKILTEIIQMSVCDGFAKATDKELVAVCNTYFIKSTFAKRLGVVPGTLNNRYGDLFNRNFITEEWIANLNPIFKDSKQQLLIDILIGFIERFKVVGFDKPSKLDDYERTLELEFMNIYNSLFDIFRNDGVIGKFIFNICNAFNIDYTSIANLKNNIHLISRCFPKGKYNHRYLMQELITLYKDKGYKKSAIATKVFNVSINYLYNSTTKSFADGINEEDLAWQYSATIDWSHMDKLAVKRFIKVLYDFMKYDV